MKRALRVAGLALAGTLAALAVASALGARWIDRALPPVGDFVEVDGTRLHYTDQGHGPPIVLVHGASSNLLEFQVSLVPLLSRHHRVLVFDRPGHGHSERGAGPWPDPAILADRLLTASESLGAVRPWLVGHSWAGSVVMSALVREPDRVAGGVLLAGVAGHWVGERNLVARLREWPLVNAVFAHTLVLPLGSQLVPTVLARVFAPAAVPAQHATRIGARLALRPASYLANAEDMHRLSAFLQRESTRYGDIGKPLLVIHGTDDDVVPWWNHGRRLQPVVPSLEVELLQGRGHALHHTDTRAVADLIASFARRHGD